MSLTIQVPELSEALSKSPCVGFELEGTGPVVAVKREDIRLLSNILNAPGFAETLRTSVEELKNGNARKATIEDHPFK